MSRDLLTSQLRASNIIGDNDLEGYPQLLLYSNIDALNNEGTKSIQLSEYLSDTDNFPTNTFAIFFGEPTLDRITEVIPQPGDNSTVFASDVMIQGTLFVNVLRDIDGNLVRLDGSYSYESTFNQQGIDLTIANTPEEADAVLANALTEITGAGGVNIGPPEDTTYTDGLFTDFTSETRLGIAIDRFNEVLKALAPAPAPALSDFNINIVSGASGKLSFGASNDLSLSSPPYFNVTDVGGFSEIDINEVYQAEAEINGNFKLDIFDKTVTITGTLNEDKSESSYENNVINFPENSFGDGEKGFLKLYLNNTEIHATDLSDPAEGAGQSGSGSGSSLNANGSGFTDLSVATPGTFASASTFSTFKHRTGNFVITPLDQVDGFNYVQVKHEIDGETRVTGTVQWVNDSNAEPLSKDASSLTANLLGNKQISGITYNTSGSIDYTASVLNAYKNIFSTDNIVYTTSSYINILNEQLPDISLAPDSEYHNTVLNIIKNSNITLPSNNRLLGGEIQVTTTIPHPIKSNLTFTDTITGFLIDNNTSLSNNLLEDFISEEFRLHEGNYDAQTDIATNAWDSSQHIVSSNTNYSNSVLQFDGKIMSTNNSDIPLLSDFSSYNNGPENNPDYSAAGGNISAGVKTYYRKIQNTTNESIRDIAYTTRGLATIIPSESSFDSSSNRIKVYFKIPDSLNSDQTGWMDAGKPYTFENSSDNDGCYIGTFNSSINSDLNKNYVSFGTKEISQNEFLVLKIEADSTWQGNIELINFNLSPVNSLNISTSPALNSINYLQSGSNRKLSFGSSLQYPPYDDVTGIGLNPEVNVNELYSSSSSRIGVLDGTVNITGTLNSNTSQSGNSYESNAWGLNKANEGTLELEINGVTAHTFSLSTNNTTNISSLNNGSSGSGFVNITPAQPGKDNNNLPDYRFIWRKAQYRIDASDQVPGWNYARSIHRYDDGTSSVTNYIEWVNDTNQVATSFGTPTFTNIVQGTTGTNHLSGVQYFTSNPLGGYSIDVNNAHKYTYSNESNAIRFTNLINTTVTNIQTSGSGIINSQSSSSIAPIPQLDVSVQNAYNNPFTINATFNYNITKSLPDTSPSPTARIACVVDGTTSSNANAPIPYVYQVNDTTQELIENFSAETYRLQEGNYSNQTDIPLGTWDSTIHLNSADTGHNTGLMFYDERLTLPKYDFSIGGIPSNPNYNTGITGTRNFYRKFINNTQDSKFGFILSLKGVGSIVESLSSMTGNNIRVFAKVPKTNNGQTTGWLNLAKPFLTGQTNDGDGCYSGVFDAVMNSDPQGVSNTVTFGTVFLSPGDYVIIKIEADSSWQGLVDRIEIGWT